MKPASSRGSAFRIMTRLGAAVQYRGNWFWVEDSDWLTKRALTAVMFVFTLADTGSPDKLPLITIPAQ